MYAKGTPPQCRQHDPNEPGEFFLLLFSLRCSATMLAGKSLPALSFFFRHSRFIQAHLGDDVAMKVSDITQDGLKLLLIKKIRGDHKNNLRLHHLSGIVSTKIRLYHLRWMSPCVSFADTDVHRTQSTKCWQKPQWHTRVNSHKCMGSGLRFSRSQHAQCQVLFAGEGSIWAGIVATTS